MNKNPLIKGTLILTIAGICTKILGFILRIFLSRALGAEGLGIYQLIFPLYMLGIVVSSYGIQTAISGFCAAAGNRQPKEQALFLKCGIILAFSVSAVLSLILYYFAPELSDSVLNESRCTSLLQTAAICIPLEAVHICINGFYYGQKKTAPPAFSQLLEQLARIGGVWFLYNLTQKGGLEFTPVYAVAGNLIGDIASILFGFSALSFTLHKKIAAKEDVPALLTAYKKILSVALPLTCNQTVMHIFHSIETILIPACLQKSGYTAGEALSTYGVLTGMALPLIMFPSTVTNAFAVMLLPAVSEARAAKNHKQILSISRGAVSICTLLGIFSTGFFFCFGEEAGMLIYENSLAGSYLKALGFLCPFLFLNVTLASILNGLRKAVSVFRNNMLCLGIRVAFIIFAIPRLGIRGYFLGFLISSILSSFLYFYALRFLKAPLLDSLNFIAKPCLSFGISYFIISLFSYIESFRYSKTLFSFGIKSALLLLIYMIFLKIFIPELSIHLLTNPGKSRIVKHKSQTF